VTEPDPPPGADDGGTGAEPPADRRPSRSRLALVVTPIVALIVAAYVGDALTTTWADKHPLLLTLLNARSRVLVLTTNQLDPVTYYVAAGLRLLASDPLFYLLGVWYGDAMVVWLEKRSKTFGEQVRMYERAFAKAAYPLVFIAPNPYICLFAGASGMPLGSFFTLNILGTVARLYLIRRVGQAFDEPIQAVLRFFDRYRLPLFVLSVALVVFVVWNDRRQGKDEIGSMLELAEHPPDISPPDIAPPGAGEPGPGESGTDPGAGAP
jgi:membrane protein DedA with SNARE-associated domain